jgi:hypothetical protein
MKRRRLSLLMFVALVAFNPGYAADDDEKNVTKEALQALNDYIGIWHGNGTAGTKPRPDPQDTWRESVNWAWRFKGDDAWLTMAFKNGKFFKSGELRYPADTKHYQLTLTTTAGKKIVFQGELEDEILTLTREDPDTKETQRLKMNLAGDGVRFIYTVEHRPAGRTVFYRDYQVACNKEGESLAAKKNKIECVVSGGLGTIPVAFKGVTYYVCCSGCRDAFMENPEKYVKEYEKKQAEKK